MSKEQLLRPRMAVKASLSFAIVASQFNLNFVQGLSDNAYREINELEPGASVSIVWAPGAFEIPLLAKIVASQKKFDAILALGVIMQGDTEHATLIAQSVTNSLQSIALEFQIPVIHEVLLVKNEEQARARCLEPELNRGIEAARAAVSAARTVRSFLPK